LVILHSLAWESGDDTIVFVLGSVEIGDDTIVFMLGCVEERGGQNIIVWGGMRRNEVMRVNRTLGWMKWMGFAEMD